VEGPPLDADHLAIVTRPTEIVEALEGLHTLERRVPLTL
jgi:hypothetical protein